MTFFEFFYVRKKKSRKTAGLRICGFFLFMLNGN